MTYLLLPGELSIKYRIVLIIALLLDLQETNIITSSIGTNHMINKWSKIGNEAAEATYTNVSIMGHLLQ